MSQPRQQFHIEPPQLDERPQRPVLFRRPIPRYYQHNPGAIVWTAPLSWGHATSKDLVHWEDQPIAMDPDMPYESTGGCFSGSAWQRRGRSPSSTPR